MKPLSFLLFVIGPAVVLAGCAGIGTQEGKRDVRLAAHYIEAAENLEKHGDLPAALEQYKLALTADPENAVAVEQHGRLSDRLSQMADERYHLGMKYYQQGKYALARNEFLTALKYRPEHPEASKMLVSREPEKPVHYVVHVVKPGESLSLIARHYFGDPRRYDVIARFNQIEDATLVKPGQRIMVPEITGAVLAGARPLSDDEQPPFVEHVLRSGESLSRLAQLYYNDYRQFHIIAQFNALDDATRVSVGQVIKVPKVAGLPFHVDRVDPELAPSRSVAPAVSPPETVPPDNQEQILAYRDSGIDYFNEGKYEDAIFELNKAIEAAPNDPQTRTYLARAYFENGRRLLDQQDFQAAQEAFEISHHYDPTCDQCQAYIERSKLGPLMVNRDTGLTHYRNNEFLQAIHHFEQFLGVRPQDDEVRTYLSRAYFQQALSDYNKGAFLEAHKRFESALLHDNNCEQCNAYITRSLEQHKEMHYNRGMVYFGREQLVEAIAEWEAVHRVDASYKDVDDNLKRARSLLQRLEQIKKSRTQR